MDCLAASAVDMLLATTVQRRDSINHDG